MPVTEVCNMTLSCWCRHCAGGHVKDKAVKFCETDLTTFHRASGKTPVFESHTSIKSDDSGDVAINTMRILTVVEIGNVSYLCGKTPFVRTIYALWKNQQTSGPANFTEALFEAFQIFRY